MVKLNSWKLVRLNSKLVRLQIEPKKVGFENKTLHNDNVSVYSK